MEMEEILNQIETGIFISDVDTDEILFANKKMKQEYGIPHPEGCKCWEIFQIGAKERCRFCKIPQLLQAEKPDTCLNWEEKNVKLGKVFRNCDSLITWEGRKAHLQQAYDITELVQLTEHASRDSLCDVWNRSSGKNMLDKKLETMEAEQSCTLVIFDIDSLKKINDDFGYAEGDQVLRNVSQYVNRQLEPPDFMFRLSGDEFVVVFFGKELKEVSRKILQWRSAMEQESVRNEKPYPISFSYGISFTRGKRNCTADELLDQADERMYEEKLRRRKNENLISNEEIAQKNKKEKLRFDYPAEYLYDALIRSTDDYLYIGNMKTEVFQYTPAQVEAFDFPGEIVENTMEYWKKIVHPDDWERFYKANMEIVENKRDAHYVEFRARERRGEYVWLRCRGQLIRDEYGNPALFAGIIHRMGGQNKIDPLTQLYNQQMFVRRIKRNVECIENESLAVMILDVDNFRQMNEMYSRSTGDRILCILAHNIQALLPDNAALFRLDNDRMGVLMANSSENEVRELYCKIQKKIRMMKEWKNYKLEVHLSAGCASYPKDGQTVDELYQYADYALQQAKRMGKDRLEIFNEEILKKKNDSLELIRKLRDAILHDFRGFYVNYQPQVGAHSKKIIGVEALARFCDRDGNNISPVDFIPVMEEEGMIYDMGLWVLKKAIRAARPWVAAKPDFSVSVNASALQILEDSFLPDIERILQEEAFSARNLVIELTESNTVQNLDIFRDKYKRLQEMGIRVAMDDFGTGYSSLEFLKNAPIDLVKIDRSFMRDILNSKFDSAFIKFIVAICHDADILVCQEGVETEEEYELLKEMGLDCIQGYYFGRPAEKTVITERLEAEFGKKEGE